MPAVVADAELLSGQVAVAVTRAATVIPAVRDVAGFSLPVLLALTVHATRDRVRRAASAVARAVVGTRVYPEGDRKLDRKSRQLFKVIQHLKAQRIVSLDNNTALRWR